MTSSLRTSIGCVIYTDVRSVDYMCKLDALQCIWKHCNRLAESVSHRRTRQVTQLFTYLLTHKLFSSCIRRYLVSRVCDWVMPTLSAVIRIFSFQFSLLFFNISLARPHQHCGVLLFLIRNIGHRTLPKTWVGTFLVRNVQPRGRH